jgi:peroxisomal membrane protein 2
MEQQDLLTRYSKSLEQNPILTKASTSGTLYALQEIIAVLATGTGNKESVTKAVKMSSYGFFVSGPLGHVLYSFMETIFKNKTGPSVGILKLLFSNLVISPILNGCYLVALASFAGASLPKAIQLAKSKLLGMMKISWVVFPLVQMYAFKNLAPKFWVPFFNFVAFVFGTMVNIQAKLEAKRSKKEIKKE